MLIVKILKEVRSDMPFQEHPFERPVVVCAGELVEAERNQHGAVSAKLRGGGLLLLKPDEFEVVADVHVGEVERLRQELAELLVDGFCQIADEQTEGTFAGWWDNGALSTALEFGERLVELGLWERHPDGYGGRWFYRPKPADTPPSSLNTRPCILCGRQLGPVCPQDGWEYRQPYGGGEVQFIFGYGSERFDLQCEPTVFWGVVCDECAARCMDKMKRRS